MKCLGNGFPAEIGRVPRRDRSEALASRWSGGRWALLRLRRWLSCASGACRAVRPVSWWSRGVTPFPTGSAPPGASERARGDRLSRPRAGRRDDRLPSGWTLLWKSSGPDAGAGSACVGLAGGGGCTWERRSSPGRTRVFRVILRFLSVRQDELTRSHVRTGGSAHMGARQPVLTIR